MASGSVSCHSSVSRSQALLTRLRLHDLKCLLHCFSKKTVDAFAVEKLTSTAKIKVVKQFTVVQLLAGSGSTPTITSAKLASRKLNAVSLVPRRCNRSWPLGASPSLPGKPPPNGQYSMAEYSMIEQSA